MQQNSLLGEEQAVPENGLLSPDVGTKEEVKKDIDPVEAAAIYVNQSHKHFRHMAYELTNRRKRSVARILEAVLFEPLEQVELNKEERKFFEFCTMIMHNKGVLLRDIFEKHADKLQKQGESNG